VTCSDLEPIDGSYPTDRPELGTCNDCDDGLARNPPDAVKVLHYTRLRGEKPYTVTIVVCARCFKDLIMDKDRERWKVLDGKELLEWLAAHDL
jgi:hypothetical protein